MAYGLIKDTTLQAMGDALRDKEVIPATREETRPVNYIKYKSSNATSLDDPTPTSRATDEVLIEAVDGAVSLDIELNIGCEYISGSAAEIFINSLDGTQTYWTKVISSTTAGVHNIHVDAPTVKIKMSPVPYQKSKGAWVAKIYFYDASGTVIPGEDTETTLVTNTLTPEAMVEAITNFEMPIAPPEEAFVLTGDCKDRFANNGWNWFIDNYGDKISTKDITNASYMFNSSNKLTEIPFVINLKDAISANNLFYGMGALEVCPKIRGTFKKVTSGNAPDLTGMLAQCGRLRDVEDLFEPETLDFFKEYKTTASYYNVRQPRFDYCYSLRRVPSWIDKLDINEENLYYPNATGSLYYSLFNYCYNLDEALNLPVWKCKAAQTSNMLVSTVAYAYRLKDFTFKTDNGTPIETQWKSQVIDFTNGVGWASSVNDVCDKNSGITKDKQVKDDVTYQALKNDPDWWTLKIEYSRYNHDSAVNTINSLPDTSAYLASAGGTNTIKFKGAAGSATDGGAINTLTDDEKDVAALKGWTVQIV